MREKLKEVPPGNSLDVQIMFHKVLDGARLGKLAWPRDVCGKTFTV